MRFGNFIKLFIVSIVAVFSFFNADSQVFKSKKKKNDLDNSSATPTLNISVDAFRNTTSTSTTATVQIEQSVLSLSSDTNTLALTDTTTLLVNRDTLKISKPDSLSIKSLKPSSTISHTVLGNLVKKDSTITKKRFALVSFYGDRKIDIPGIDDKLARKLWVDSANAIANITQENYKLFLNVIKNAELEILNNEDVISQPFYIDFQTTKDSVSNIIIDGNYIGASGLKVLFPSDLFIPRKKLPPRIFGTAFDELELAEGTLFVKMSYRVPDSFRNLKFEVSMELSFYDIEGSNIFNTSINYLSKENIFGNEPEANATEDAARILRVARESSFILINNILVAKIPAINKAINKPPKEEKPEKPRIKF